MDLLQIIVLGIVQAVTEWIPLSSKTMDALAYTALFGGSEEKVISVILFLHIGTLIASIIYFRKEIAEHLRSFLRAPANIAMHKNSQIGFLFTALLFTGVVGVPLLLIEMFVLPGLEMSLLLLLMGAGLILTGFLLSSQHKKKWRVFRSATWEDGVLTGVLQGLSVLPGVSRAGASTTALIWRGFDAESSFHLSFLLAIPTVFLAEIILWAWQGGISAIPIEEGIALAASSFIFGYITLDALLKIAQKTNVAWLAFVFGIMMVVFGLLGVG